MSFGRLVEQVVEGVRRRTVVYLRSNYVKPGIYISTVCLLVKQYRVYGVMVAVPFIATVQYILLYLESCGGASARVIKLDVVGAGSSGARAVENDFSKALDVDGERRRNLAAAIRMDRILERCTELQNPRYIPTPWASDTWTNLGLHMLKCHLYSKLIHVPIRKHLIALKDGGEVSIEECSHPSLPRDAPIIIILHTITGSSKDMNHYLQEALNRGWRGIVFNRRGHDGVLKTPTFNLMGDAADTVEQVSLVRSLYPESFLGMVGISAGSGLLVNYLGKEAEKTPIQAACGLCPAYDISKAFKMLSVNFPQIDRVMVNSVKQLFIHPNSELLGSHSLENLEMCANAETLDEFLRHHHIFAGCSSADEYFQENNPMEWISQVSVPILIVNSEDDVVCLPENIREDLFKYRYGNALLLKTKRGSHIAYNEGVFGTGSYLPRVSLDFLEAARRVLDPGLELSATEAAEASLDAGYCTLLGGEEGGILGIGL